MTARNGMNGIELIDIETITQDDGRIIVTEEGGTVPFPIKRVFAVLDASAGALRGKHAHRSCTELLVCLTGEVDVTMTDGEAERTEILSSPERALKIPPMVWSTQRYIAPGTVLMVICDEPYDEGEYIRDYNSFLNERT